MIDYSIILKLETLSLEEAKDVLKVVNAIRLKRKGEIRVTFDTINSSTAHLEFETLEATFPHLLIVDY